MAYDTVKHSATFLLKDNEGREKRKELEINSAFTQTDQIAQALNDMMGGAAVPAYTYNQKQAWDGVITYDDTGDVNDKTNLIFLTNTQDKVAHPVYDLDQSCFVDTEGPNARVVKGFAALDAAAPGSPAKALATYISFITAGSIIISRYDIVDYVEGYKAD